MVLWRISVTSPSLLHYLLRTVVSHGKPWRILESKCKEEFICWTDCRRMCVMLGQWEQCSAKVGRRVSSNQWRYHKNLQKIKAHLYHTVRTNCESQQCIWASGSRTRTRSLAPSAERTILSPFTKEYRAPGALTGIDSFLDCPHGAQPRKIKAEEAVILQTKRSKNLFDASHKEFAKSQRDRKLARSMPWR